MSYLRKRRQKKHAAQAREGRLCQREQEPTPTAAESQADVAQSPPREHQMVCLMDAYCMGLTAKDAQFHVRMYSSKKYKSHRRVPERLACQFDQ